MSSVRDFGAVGDGVVDDTDAIQHALNDGDGLIEFPRGEYLVTRTLVVDLANRGRTSISGLGNRWSHRHGWPRSGPAAEGFTHHLCRSTGLSTGRMAE